MGQSCTPQCCTIQMEIQEVHVSAKAEVERLNLSTINILDYEKRVKKYAHPCNQSKVSISQLKLAFVDTGIFNQLGKTRSVVHRLLTSPFFKNFSLGRIHRNQEFYEEMEQYYSPQLSAREEEEERDLSVKVHPIISNDVVNRTKANPLVDAEQRKLSQINSTKSIRSFRATQEVESMREEEAWISVDALILLGCVHCLGLYS